MVAAAQAALLDDAVLERRVAVRAMQVQAADAPAEIAEHHEILAQRAHAQRHFGKLAQIGDRLPEAAVIFASRRAAHHLAKEKIGLRLRVAVIPAVAQRCGPHLLVRFTHVLPPSDAA